MNNDLITQEKSKGTMNEKEKEIDIPWLKKHFGSEGSEKSAFTPDPDFVAMLEELEYK